MFCHSSLTFTDVIEKDPTVKKQEVESSKCQAVISLDEAEWKEIIKLWDVKEPMIRHRQQAGPSDNSRGWYT